MKKPWSKRLADRAKRDPVRYPIGTIAFYGSDDRHASKVAVGVRREGEDHVTTLERWFERGLDVRIDPQIGEEVVAFLRRHGVRSVVVTRGIIGCPHEEGVDYPAGAECPLCPFWAGKDRWANA